MLMPLFVVPLATLAAQQATASPPVLPDEWRGQWRGTLAIAGASGQTIPMGLDIEAVEGRDAMTWRIIYGEGDRRQVRNYELLPGEAPGRLVIDEKNGIVLDARLEGAVMVSVFEAQGTTLVARYELAGDELRYEILSWSEQGARLNTLDDPMTPMMVMSHPVSGYQRATLRRR